MHIDSFLLENSRDTVTKSTLHPSLCQLAPCTPQQVVSCILQTMCQRLLNGQDALHFIDRLSFSFNLTHYCFQLSPESSFRALNHRQHKQCQ